MKVRFFKQHSGETCGISCVQMALDAFGVDFPTVQKERKYYNMYGSRATRGTLGAAIAYVLSRKGLDVRLVHQSKELVENRGNYFPEDEYRDILCEHISYIERAEGAFPVETGVPVTLERLRKELDEERLVILQILVDGSIDSRHSKSMHWVLLYGYEDSGFLVCDPACGKCIFTDEEMRECMETPFVSSFISVGKKKEEHR